MKDFIQFGKALSQISQLGLSVAAPIVLSVWVSGWISRKFGLGNWVMLIGIVLGVGGAAASAVKFYQSVIKRKGGD